MTYGNELYLEERIAKDCEADEDVEEHRPEGRTVLETTYNKTREETSWAH